MRRVAYLSSDNFVWFVGVLFDCLGECESTDEVDDFIVLLAGAGLYFCFRFDDFWSDLVSSEYGDWCNATDVHCHRWPDVTAVDSDIRCNLSYAVT